MSRFPRLTSNGNESSFPDVSNVRTYQYDNQFDYSKYDSVQMNIQLCKVPWDMGEAHVGNRTISGIGNVVYFGSKSRRDRWFERISKDDCFRFSTKYKELHRDNYIDVPIPFDVAARYNYVAITYEPFANSESLVEYESVDSLHNWYWFVREVEFLSPNTTRLHLLNDAWQTFIYDMNIPYMVLERGHYGIANTNVDSYLSNPIGNCSLLLSPEENEPLAPRIATATHEHVFNSGTMYCVIVTSANSGGSWGSKSDDTWHVPFTHVYMQGTPGYRAFAIEAGNLATLLNNVSSYYPQFSQTVQAVFFVGESLLSLGNTYTFAGVTCWVLSANYTSATVHTLSRKDFNYPAQYEELAKLYTYPYAVIELTDSDGNITDVHIEDTNGTIQIDYCLSLAYPWLKIDGAITSVGKTRRRNIRFANGNSRTMPIAGNWQDLLFSWDVPTFAITESAAKVNDYATHFDRAQQAYAADNAQTNANASADTAQSNMNASADTAQSNQNANATLTVDNATLTTTANSAITAISNGSADSALDNTRSYNFDAMDSDNATTYSTASATIQAEEQQAAIAAASGAATGAVGAISALANGNIAGAVSSAVNGLIGAGTTIASTSVSVHLTAAQAGIAATNNSWHAEAATDKSAADAAAQKSAASSMTSAQNTLTSGVAANSAATQRANASRDNSTQRANASRDNSTQRANATRNRATVTSAINNQIKQAALNAPETFGDFSSGEHATTRPVALFSNVLTQDDNAIKRFGDEFLRYGYALNAQIPFDGNWCIMEHFTYWKLSDFWVSDLKIPDMYVDKIRFFLLGGVTVWNDPSEIGRVNIYDN